MEIDCRSLHARLEAGETLTLVDCREPEEYSIAHIAGAKLVPMSCFVERAAELAGDKANDVVVFCHHGGRSLRVAAWMRQNGWGKARSLQGGIDAWSQQIDPSVPRY